MSVAQEAAAGVVADLAAEAEPEQEGASSDQGAAAAEQVQPEAAPETPAFDPDPELPDEIVAMLDEPDFEADAAAEVEAEAEDTPDEYTDPALAEERRKRVAAEKRAAFLEQRVVATSKAKWTEEAKHYFPFSDPASITATSRRGFLREAKAQHERVKEIPSIKAMIERGQQSAQVVAEEAVEVARGEVAQAWGKPLTGPASAPQEAVAAQQHAEKIASAKTLVERTKLRLAGSNALGLVEPEGE